MKNLMLSNIFLYVWTIKDLKIIQILYRAKLIFFKNFPVMKKYDLKINYTSKKKFNWILKPVQFPENNVYNFLNKSLKVKNFSLNQQTSDKKLWLYNLNYFDFLISKKAFTKKNKSISIIKEWININPSKNKIGWDPYPTSLRIVNWIKWCIINNNYDKNILNSIYVQGVYLNENIEWHLLGNHLIANAKGLIFFGTFFSNKKANTLLKNGENLLYNQIGEQFLNDGGHFERSPMYHSILLEDLLDIIELNSIFPNKISKNLIKKIKSKTKIALEWLISTCHPDKNISFFNDTTNEIASHPSKIINFYNKYNKEVNFKNQKTKKFYSLFLNTSKYYICENKDFKAIVDLGSPSPKYQPGHSHAETFSFELSLFKKRVFVNTGISQYQISQRRTLERSTVSHNTACIKKKNSSQVWSAFRVAKKAKILDIFEERKKEYSILKMKHDGFSSALQTVIHNREIRFSKNKIEFRDKISQSNEYFAVYILHPDIKIILKQNDYFLKVGLNKEARLFFNNSKVELIDWYYAPKFGVLIKTKCFHVSPNNDIINTCIQWN